MLRLGSAGPGGRPCLCLLGGGSRVDDFVLVTSLYSSVNIGSRVLPMEWAQCRAQSKCSKIVISYLLRTSDGGKQLYQEYQMWIFSLDGVTYILICMQFDMYTLLLY